MRICISGAALRAVAILAAKKDIRYYLNGVHVEATPTHTRIAACDGSVLGVYQEPCENYLAGYPGPFTVPGEVLALLPAKAFAVEFTSSAFLGKAGELDDGAVVADGRAAFPFKPVEGTYPQISRVIPTTVSGVGAQINPEYIAAFVKVAKAFGLKPGAVHIHHNGEDGAPVTLRGAPGFAGVAMPLRSTEKSPFPLLANGWAARPLGANHA